MHRDDGVERVCLAIQHRPGFEIFAEDGQGLDLALQIGEHVLALLCQFEVGLDLGGAAEQSFVVGHQRFQALAVAHQWFSGVGIGPESRIGQLGFYFCGLPADASRVKDTPAGRGLDRAQEHKRIRDRSTTWLGS